MKITIIGTGYVGLSLATLLSISENVIAYDIDKSKVSMINDRISPIVDKEIEEIFSNIKINLLATTDFKEALKDSNLAIIATPTNYDEETDKFDTSSIESVMDQIITINKDLPVIIKSTIPVGYTDKLKHAYNKSNICFSPEFLREGKALYDNMYPSRIIVGSSDDFAINFANLLKKSAQKKDIEVLFMSNKEAEAVKLFANTYLAMRVSYFNEMDTYAEINGLDTSNLIHGLGLDPRIGMHYNNPSFGYGGYCLPKDTKQLLANFNGTPQNLISAIVESNNTRKRHITNMILSKNPKVVGIYRLTMKEGSDNFRQSAIQDIINFLVADNIEVIIYEPKIEGETFNGHPVCNVLNDFKNKADVIICNRLSYELDDVKHKIYTRDIFNDN